MKTPLDNTPGYTFRDPQKLPTQVTITEIRRVDGSIKVNPRESEGKISEVGCQHAQDTRMDYLVSPSHSDHILVLHTTRGASDAKTVHFPGAACGCRKKQS